MVISFSNKTLYHFEAVNVAMFRGVLSLTHFIDEKKLGEKYGGGGAGREMESSCST